MPICEVGLCETYMFILLQKECFQRYAGIALSVCPSMCLSVYKMLVNTLASTNINQSAPNLVKMYVTIRSGISVIMNLIRLELSQLCALQLENLLYLTLFSL